MYSQKVLKVTADTPGYTPSLKTSIMPKSAVSHSVAAPASATVPSVAKLFYQTSADSKYFCIICHAAYKSMGPLETYLIFVISFTQAGFSKAKFYTKKKPLKTPKTLKMSLKKSNVCSFF